MNRWIALVGKNGAEQVYALKMLSGEEKNQLGEINKKRDLSLYLAPG